MILFVDYSPRCILIEILSCETKYINFKGKRSFNEELAFKLLQNVDTILRYNFTVGSQLNNRTLVSYIEILQMYTYNTQAEKSLLDDMSNVNNTKVLTMKHMNYILSGIKGMISDCHSRNSEINLKASPLMLEYLKLQSSKVVNLIPVSLCNSIPAFTFKPYLKSGLVV